MNISSTTIVTRLTTEFDYTDQEARLVVDELLGSTPEIQQAFEQWWCHNELAESLEAHGYTLQRLVDELDLHPAAALLTMDWLIREPSAALRAIEEGYDTYELEAEGGENG